jgi:outer membrane immunogenic protein
MSDFESSRADGLMHKALCGAVAAIALIGTPAFAADTPVKAPPPSPAPVYSWTGWYVGGNIGASYGTFKTDFNAPLTVAVTDNSPSAGTASGVSTFGFPDSNTTHPSGLIGGGQIGYNWQLSPVWVASLEADFQGDLERHSNTATGYFDGDVEGSFPNGDELSAHALGSTVLNYQTKIDWFGTVRGRVGYLFWDGAVLAYVTGGLAYGKVDVDGTSTVNAEIQSVTPFSVTSAFSHNAVNVGWVVGSGTEGKLFIPG